MRRLVQDAAAAMSVDVNGLLSRMFEELYRAKRGGTAPSPQPGQNSAGSP
jgi:hypothetical protein